ncbi:MAG TPA: hypothetical protein VHX36_09535 [Candidatus Acidoferrales bacterium]|jgi:hypothetical protein|nr:hypothetical protein [Candidatus Acidoferrales bacterium]
METKAANSSVSIASSHAKDLICSGKAVFIWYVPIAALVFGASWVSARAWLWIPALLVMGIGCLANAAQCGRTHCYFTGPLYLLATVYVALAEFNVVPMNPNIFLGAVLFLTVLAYLAEFPLGKYRKKG